MRAQSVTREYISVTLIYMGHIVIFEFHCDGENKNKKNTSDECKML